MGSVEYDNYRLTIYSHITIYGNAATPELAKQMREEIESMWNEPQARVRFMTKVIPVVFIITATVQSDIQPIEIYQNIDPRNNYFRIEEFAHGNISFVDGLGCNSGYFKLENLYKGSTTAAHEYGHTLGLDHPKHLDIRGRGVPGIMYPRGTLVDPPFQYDPSKPAGVTGGTMYPIHRKVKQEDIDNLKIHKLAFENRQAIIGAFTNVYHWNHGEMPQEQFMKPPIYG
jgi:hypothetical protein